MSLKDKIIADKLPVHIAIIMDGNGRWAKKHGKDRIFGHHQGVESVRKVSEAGAKLGIKYLTLYTFSTENWNRPVAEVDALMHLLVETIQNEVVTLNKNNIRLNAIGDLNSLPPKNLELLNDAIKQTSKNDRMTLTMAISYSSRWEITEAARMIAAKKLKPEEITEDVFASFLNTYNMPDPELLIRTSGEMRISNYLLWQIAYSELYFTSKLWPEFDEEELYSAIISYQNRERRFGLTSEQIKS
ncbi:MAG TPA: isoprenyl transferase [Bacteroidales bacterium]